MFSMIVVLLSLCGLLGNLLMYVCLIVVVVCSLIFFFFKQKTAYEMRISDWSSDVCSSDLLLRSRMPWRSRSDLMTSRHWRCSRSISPISSRYLAFKIPSHDPWFGRGRWL